jgi:hypothetical protein
MSFVINKLSGLDRLWDPPSLQSNWYRGLFPGDKVTGAWSWPLTFNYCRGQEFWSYNSSPLCVFVEQGDNFTFTTVMKGFCKSMLWLSKHCCHLMLSIIVSMRHELATTKMLNHGRVIVHLLLYLFLFILNGVVDSMSQNFCYFPIYLTIRSLLQNSYFCLRDICKPYILTAF